MSGGVPSTFVQGLGKISCADLRNQGMFCVGPGHGTHLAWWAIPALVVNVAGFVALCQVGRKREWLQ